VSFEGLDLTQCQDSCSFETYYQVSAFQVTIKGSSLGQEVLILAKGISMPLYVVSNIDSEVRESIMAAVNSVGNHNSLDVSCLKHVCFPPWIAFSVGMSAGISTPIPIDVAINSPPRIPTRGN
jgi:hypothetical protein